MENKFYTIDQVAEVLDIHHKTVRKFIKEGRLKANKIGKQWRISQVDLDLFMKNKKSICNNEEFNYYDEIEFSNNENINKVTKAIRISSVIDLEDIDGEAYSRISNMLLAIMNCKTDKEKGHTINMKYSKNINRLRVMLWANIDTTKEVLDVISILTEDKNKGEDNNEI